MCLAEFAAYYYKDYKTDISEKIDAQPEVLTSYYDIISPPFSLPSMETRN